MHSQKITTLRTDITEIIVKWSIKSIIKKKQSRLLRNACASLKFKRYNF